MIVVRLKGGMGNQMFQYAFGRQLAELLDTELRLDLSVLLSRNKQALVHRDYDLPIFNIRARPLVTPSLIKKTYGLKISRISKWMRRYPLRGRRHIKEPHFHVDPTLIGNPVDQAIYEGWFQSRKYFKGVEDVLRDEFAFVHPLLKVSVDLMDEITSCNAVCLNVRRTDFLKVATLNVTDRAYFLRAAEEMATRVEDPVFFVFSDDVEWCRANITLDHPTRFVGHEHKGIKFGNYLRLMAACKHFIIPNSSFAWWTIWIGNGASPVVIVPSRWFADPSIITSDVVEENWIRL